MQIEILQNKYAGLIKDAYSFRDETTIVIEKENILRLCLGLKNDPEYSLDFLTDLCGLDFWPASPRFCVVYHLYSLTHRHRLRLKVFLEEADAALESVSPIWGTANWHERECFDLFGIKFHNHPDLRRILLPDNFAGYPLRKDFPLEGR